MIKWLQFQADSKIKAWSCKVFMARLGTMTVCWHCQNIITVMVVYFEVSSYSNLQARSK